MPRLAVRVTGVVQGVGFRPSVYRAATALGLEGWVRNGAGGVAIEVEGPEPALRDFLEALLLVDGPSFTRLAHLRPSPLPGGERAAREPRRAALGLLAELLGPAAAADLARPWFRAADLPPPCALLASGRLAPRTTSAGRLFDAVAALTGLRFQRGHEGQLTGGCFQNHRLLTGARARLIARGVDVLTPRLVPPNDGGISLGQAVIARARLASRAEPPASHRPTRGAG